MSGQDRPEHAEFLFGWDCPGRGRGRGFGGGRGRGRMFDNGDLRLIILHLLADHPSHGYEIIKALEERVGGGYSPSPGVIYPTLTLLEELGHALVAEERGGRRLYSLTPEGHAALAASRDAIAAIFARLDSAAASRSGPPPQVARALENLAMAVRLRLQGRTATEAQVRAIAAAIDAAARTVEET
ncbi:MAG: PadR family transcriptional regulator [Rhodopila sp.]